MRHEIQPASSAECEYDHSELCFNGWKVSLSLFSLNRHTNKPAPSRIGEEPVTQVHPQQGRRRRRRRRTRVAGVDWGGRRGGAALSAAAEQVSPAERYRLPPVASLAPGTVPALRSARLSRPVSSRCRRVLRRGCSAPSRFPARDTRAISACEAPLASPRPRLWPRPLSAGGPASSRHTPAHSQPRARLRCGLGRAPVCTARPSACGPPPQVGT